MVVALGGCACYGNITRFGRGGQQNQPAHEAYLPIGDLIKVDVYIPGCAPSPQMIRNVAVMAYLLLKGTKEQKDLATAFLKPLMMAADKGTKVSALDAAAVLQSARSVQSPWNMESQMVSATCASSAVPATTSARGAGSALMWYRITRRSTRPLWRHSSEGD